MGKNRSHQTRLDAALIRNRAIRDASRLRELFERQVPSSEIEFVQHEIAYQTSNEFYSKINEARKQRILKTWAKFDETSFARWLSQLPKEYGDMTFLVFLEHWNHAGGLRLLGYDFFRHAKELLHLDGDGVIAGTKGGMTVVALDLFQDESVPYEVAVVDQRSM